MGKSREDFLDDRLLPEGVPSGQRAAVTASQGLIAVGAGAGTGKTWVLANRYARLLLTTPDCLPRDILTLTFTDAAAGEMRGRIEARVRELMDLPEAPVDEARKKAVIDGFGEAWISTIHAAAARLIRETGLSLNVDPRASVVSDTAAENFWNRLREAAEEGRLRELAAGCCARLTEAAEALDAHPLFSAAVGCWRADALSALARSAVELHADMGRTWEDMLQWAEDALREDDPRTAAARRELEPLLRIVWCRAWDTWREAFAELGDELRAEGEQGKPQDVPLMKCLELWEYRLANGPEGDDLRRFYAWITDKANIRGGRTTAWNKLNKLLPMTFGKWQDAEIASLAPMVTAFQSGEALSGEERRMRSLLLRFCGVAWGLWSAMKARRGVLSFSDMILDARTAVGGSSGTAEKKVFRHILVDEFQDTDFLQFDMVTRMRTQETRSFFTVGDPKQSIYRFRHAEPALFAGIMNQADTRVALDVSFRTRRALLTRINDLFAHIWREGLGVSDAMSSLRFEPLEPAPGDGERDGGAMPSFSMRLAMMGEDKVDEARRRLADRLAQDIADWVAEGRTVWDKEKGALRPVRFRDFAVLLRTRRQHDMLERALAARGIRSIQDHSFSYFSRSEVTDVISLLRAAADLRDDEAVGGWLLSPFSGVPAGQALECLGRVVSGKNSKNGKGGKGGKDRGGHLMEAVRQDLPRAAARLELIARMGRQNGPAAILEPLDRDRRWLENYAPSDRLRALRNVRRALSIARSFQRGPASGLIACADWMERALRRGLSMDEPGWHSPQEDAVLLSTIHASKGLEYPVVLIFDLPKKAKTGTLRPSRTFGAVFSSMPDEAGARPTAEGGKGAQICCSVAETFLESQGEQEEDMRLLYVAATRARDALVVCGLVKESADGDKTPCGVVAAEKGWTAVLLPWLMERGECDENCQGPNIVLVEPDWSPKYAGGRSGEALLMRTAALPDWSGITLGTMSATSLAMMEWCPLAWRRRYRQGLDLLWDSPDQETRAEDDGRGGASLGSLAHWILARWPSGKDDDDEALNRWLTNPDVRLHLPSPLRETWDDLAGRRTLQRCLGGFLKSEAGALVRRALKRGARREARFRLDMEGITLTGAMDVVWAEEGGLWRVLDYKITKDALAEDAPRELYSSQMDFYALAAAEGARRMGAECRAVDVGLVFLEREGLPMVTERREDWEALRRRVREAARLGAQTDPLPKPKLEHCPRCPWRSHCREAAATER